MILGDGLVLLKKLCTVILALTDATLCGIDPIVVPFRHVVRKAPPSVMTFPSLNMSGTFDQSSSIRQL